VTRRATLVAAALGIVLAAGAAPAGVRVELRSVETGGEGGKPLRYVVFVDGPRLAVELARKDGVPAKRRVVFRSDRDLVWLVDHERRTYYQLDPESARQVASQVAGLKEGLEQGLESLTPEQREAVRELLGELAAPSAAGAPEYRLEEKGELGRYAEIACARHDVLEGAKRVAELCLAEYGKPPLSREALAAVPALGGFLRRTLEPLLAQFPSLRPVATFAALDRAPGVPLLVRSFGDKGESRETTVTRVAEEPVDAALFELPAGYARSWVPPFR
jgi:hypothetical protein